MSSADPIRLTPAEQLSFVAALSTAAAQAFARDRDQAELARAVMRVMSEAERLRGGASLPLCAHVSLLTQALMLASKSHATMIDDWVAILTGLAALAGKVNAEQREGIERVRAAT